MIDQYDIKRKTTTYADGVDSVTWAVNSTEKMDVQPIRYDTGRSGAVLEIVVGGERFVPTFRGFASLESNATATDRITPDSGITDLLVLRTYDYEDHKELDLRDVND